MCEHLAQQPLECGGNAADAGDRQMHGIAAQVALGEIGEGFRHHSPHLGAIQVRMYERRERRQETVGIRLAVDPEDDLLIGQPMRREELLPQGDMPFENTSCNSLKTERT